MGLFDAINPLVKIAKKVVNSVQGQLRKVENEIVSLALKPIELMIKEVTGGVWRGDGADEFVRQCTKLFVPELRRISGSVSTMNSGIGKALEIMNKADNDAFRQVSNLTNIFKGIGK